MINLTHRYSTARVRDVFANVLVQTPHTVPKRVTWCVLALLLAVAAATRLIGLGASSVWPDPGFTYTMTQQPFWALLSVPLDVHPPVYYLLTKAATFFGDNEVWLRLPSALFGISAVYVIYLIVSKYAGPFGALCAAALAASSYPLIHFSQEARMYSLLFLLLAVATLAYQSIMARMACEKALKASPSAFAMHLTYFGAAAFALYTHIVSVIFLGALGLASLPLVLSAIRVGRHREAAAWLSVNGLAVLVWLPWLIGFFYVGGAAKTDHLVQASIFSGLHSLLRLLSGAMPGWYLNLPLFIFIIIGAAIAAFKLPRSGIVTCVAVAIVFPTLLWLMGLVQPMFFERTLLPALLGAFIVIGLAVAYLPFPRWLSVFLISIIFGIQTAAVVNASKELSRQDWREAAAVMKDLHTPKSAYLIANLYSYHAFRFYVRPDPTSVHFSWDETSERFINFDDSTFMANHGRPPLERTDLLKPVKTFPDNLEKLIAVRLKYSDSSLPSEAQTTLKKNGWNVASRRVVDGSRAALEIIEFSRRETLR